MYWWGAERGWRMRFFRGSLGARAFWQSERCPVMPLPAAPHPRSPAHLPSAWSLEASSNCMAV